MRRFVSLVFAVLLLATVTAGCGQTQAPSDGKLSIVCTIFPIYDWTRQILGEKEEDVNLQLLLQNRIDLHNYQPSVEDIAKITTCDLFIYVGGESDEWVEDVLRQASNQNMRVISLMDVLGDDVKLEEIIEGMEEDDDDDDDDHDDHEEEYDEHVWLSLIHAQTFSSAIANELMEMDNNNAGLYQSNLDAYAAKLQELHGRYRAVASDAEVKTLLFADRFPFRYLVDDYGIAYYAAFPGCSAETEASFATMVFLTDKVDDLGLRSIMVTESSDKSIATTVISSSRDKDQQILVLDAMQSISSSDIQAGATYLSIMESNLEVLKEALSG